MVKRKCTACSRSLSIDNFYKKHRKTGRHDVQAKCKDCFNNLVYDRMMRRKLQAIEFLGGKCKHCNFSGNPAAFDFHHIESKKKDVNISSITQRSWIKIKKELSKCILLCSNCHRIEHSKK